jgi:hypothetical protein
LARTDYEASSVTERHTRAGLVPVRWRLPVFCSIVTRTNPVNTNVTCPKCGSNAVKSTGWLWKLGAIWLGYGVFELLMAAMVPAGGPVWSYQTLRSVVMGLIFAGFWAGFWKYFGPRWRCRKCNHSWR